jgi:hypothetical protein
MWATSRKVFSYSKQKIGSAKKGLFYDFKNDLLSKKVLNCYAAVFCKVGTFKLKFIFYCSNVKSNYFIQICFFLIFSVISTILSTLQIEGFDVKALRAFRVLRPLRLVSGVPSKTIFYIFKRNFHCFNFFKSLPYLVCSSM